MQLVSGRSGAAAVYPPAFCRGIVEAQDMWQRREIQERAMPLMGFERVDLIDPEEEANIANIEREGVYWDDIKEMALDPVLAEKI